MPKGIRNQPKESTPPMNAGPAGAPAPMIILQPQDSGTRIDAYGLTHIECIDELRHALIHLVAIQSGVTLISTTVSRQAAIAVVPARKAPAGTTIQPNGTGPKIKAPIRRLPRYDDEPDLREDLADELDRITG
jgi:hypothetical protein